MRRCRLPVVVLSTLVLLFLSGFLFSPWHVHLRSKVCPFSALDNAGLEEPTAGAVIPLPSSYTGVRVLEGNDRRELSTFLEIGDSRAPPAWLLS